MKVSVCEPLCHVPLCLRLNFEELNLEIGIDEKDDETSDYAPVATSIFCLASTSKHSFSKSINESGYGSWSSTSQRLLK